MANLTRYCKAYVGGDLREFHGWTEHVVSPPESDVFYVHESYVVTRGIYTDEDVVFDMVTPEWIDFCHRVLKFAVPDYLSGASDEGPQPEAA